MRLIDRLSDLEIRKATEPGMLADGHGLYLKIAGGGSKSWIFRYRNSTSGNGKQRDMGLGAYPLYSLATARKRRDEKRRMLADKIDPIEHEKAKATKDKIEAAKAVSFKDCAEQYIAAHRHGWKSTKHADQWTSTLTTWVFPIIGALPVASVDSALVMKVLQQPVGEETFWTAKCETASRVRGRIEAVLGYAKSQKLRADNPAVWSDLKHLLPARSKVAPVEHHEALPYAALPAFMAELRVNDCVEARALEWTILCAVRTGDTVGAIWAEIDWEAKTWTIPAGRLKAKKGTVRSNHVVPLSDRAIEILDGLPKADAMAPIFGLHCMSMLELLRDLRPGLTVHGFRSSFKDWAAETTAYPNEMSELALAHTVGSAVELAYRRGDMRAKRAKMMQDWSTYCSSPPRAKGGNVVALRG